MEVEHRLEIRDAGGGGGEVVVHQGLGGLERLEGVVIGGEGGDASRVRVVERDVGQGEDSGQSLENIDLDEWRCGKGEKMKIRRGRRSFYRSKLPKKAITHRSGEALEVTRQLHGLLDAVDDAVGRIQSGGVNRDRVGAEEDWMGRAEQCEWMILRPIEEGDDGAKRLTERDGSKKRTYRECRWNQAKP